MSMMSIVGLDVQVHVISNYLRGKIDLANHSSWHHELQLRDKCCIVSSPVGLYLDVELHNLFHHALCDVEQDRVFPVAPQ